MDVNQIRNKFLSFFKDKSHQIISSSPMVVKDDPTLMFVNAGMNQFKDFFLGNKTAQHNRVTNTQKCLRVSGKHNDLEEVGVDTYHHTMFEMLGNWSFGDYFKKEAIDYAWELLVDIYKIDPELLYVTVFEGDQQDGIPQDEDAINTWRELVDTSKILEFGKKDNFWEMGEQGPCGPCSEIHVDLRSAKERKEVDGGSLVNTGHPQVVELWNLVFIEFNRQSNGTLAPLPEKHVDTGMGLERLCMVLQTKKSNYDTDVFQPLIKEVENLAGIDYGKSEELDVACRVIADHIRAISFSIADGQLPYREGAGYVIRRILRRAVRYGYSFLSMNTPFLYQLVPLLVKQMGDQFPELKKQQELIERIVKEEEYSFLRTLDRGMKKLKNTNAPITGKFAFELFDTYGFPIDLTALIAKERGIAVDMVGFQAEMEKQKQRARKASHVIAEDWVELSAGPGDDFIGYEQMEAEVKMLRYRQITSKGKSQYQFVFDKTPFYPEGGGQVGDTGVINWGNDVIKVLNTKKENNVIVHFVEQLPSNPEANGFAKVNAINRQETAKNHSATHLLHAALRNKLGAHVEQRGSLVNSEYLRFDFSHFSKISKTDLDAIEKEVNDKVTKNIQLEIQHMPIGEAKQMGAMALFGEKYGEEVRVVIFDKEYSIELCGGTHVDETEMIKAFKITDETSIASGIRRIEAVTGEKAIEKTNTQQLKLDKLLNDIEHAHNLSSSVEIIDELEIVPVNKLLKEINIIQKTLESIASLKLSEQLKYKKEMLGGVTNFQEIEGKIQDYLSLVSKLTKYHNKVMHSYSSLVKEDLKAKGIKVNGVNKIVERVDGLDADAMKTIAFQLRKELSNVFIVLGCGHKGKALLTVVISDNLINSHSLNATQVIRDIAKEIKGGGGGQPFFSTAGGSDINGLERALEKAKTYLS